jgi:hypothetical protein
MTIKVIDNFFDSTILFELKTAIQNEIQDKKCDINYAEQHHAPTVKDNDALDDQKLLLTEKDHFGLTNCKYYLLKNESKKIILNTLVKKNYVSKEILNDMDCMLRYHVNKAPYGAKWHLDGLYEKNDSLDYVGITIFLNDTWNPNHGGLFVYKKNKDDSQGMFVEPIGNRIIINPEDLPHAVTQISDPNIVRYSLQMFINNKYLI